MNLQATKIELIEMLINTQKPNVLKKIKEILVAQQNGHIKSSVTSRSCDE